MAVHLNNKAVLLSLFGIAGIVAIYLYYPSKEADKKAALSAIDVRDSKDSLLKKLTEGKVPPRSITMSWDSQKAAAVANSGIKLFEGHVDVAGVQVYRREMIDTLKHPKGAILFLHGVNFSSKTWLDLGTLNVTANNGYRVVAIDLPGFGQTKQPTGKDTDKAQFMMQLMNVIGMDSDKPIIVSPSMSGSYSLPLLFRHSEAFKGYIPVAPVGVNNYKADQYTGNKVSICSIVGDKDLGLGKAATAMFSTMPNKEIHTLTDAGHACYLDQPQEFHKIMFAFAKKLFGG